MQRKNTSQWILIIGLVIVFGYFGLDKFIAPEFWIGWIPDWMEGLLGMTRETWLSVIGVTEVILAIMLLIPHYRVRQAGAAIIALHLLAIVFEVGWNDIGVRDIGLLAMAVALFFSLEENH